MDWRYFPAVLRMSALGVLVLVSSSLIATAQDQSTLRKTNINAHDGGKAVSYTMYNESYALVVGASKYTAPDWDKLTIVPDETELVKKELESQGFDVKVVNDPDSDTLLKSIREFFRTPHPRDTRMLFYYSGHGYTSKTDHMGYIVPVDTPDRDGTDFYNKLVSLQEIRGMLPFGRAKHVLLVFDSCFSGYIFKLRRNSRPSPDEIYLNDIDRPGRQFITSGDEDEAVPDKLDFAQAFASGIDGMADLNHDTITTASELGYYLKKQIKPKKLQSPQYGVDPGDKERNEFFNGDMVFVSDSTQQSPPDASTKVAAIEPTGAQLPGPRGANLRGLGDPESHEADVFKGVEVLYYRKLTDNKLVTDALENAHIPYSVTAADLPDEFVTNGIACGPDVPLPALKALAKQLIAANVPLRKIIRFRKPSEKPFRLEVLAITKEAAGIQALDSPPLTIDQIDKLTTCPVSLQN
ncbi:caspase family protein [Mesorhizobium sp. WSM4887]|uniref:caspase family protein n=1 Tax=Mesorhizobium sp. WSM4887 TaxID=3038543 RepID=UPI002415E193|nr:caspase family protein [Mesorhizobium sp. WSM4887]MDG4889732.1 caspase family protein [Mesorhizobium sp. WSM4887]